MEIIAVANQKGGCGKTTTAINLSACLGKRRQRVLLIDMDPQGHASLGLGLQCEDKEGLYEVFLREVTLSEVIIPDVAEKVDLVPGTISLAAVEHLLSDTPEREWRLASHLAQLEGKYDYVVIDCPPSLGLLSFNALRAADRVLVPMEMSAFSLDGVERLTETIDLLAEKYQTELPVTMLPTMVDMRPRFSKEMMREVNELFSEELSRATIHYTVRLKEAARKGVPVIELDPECIAAADYDRLSREMMGEKVGRVTVTAFQEVVMPKQAEKAVAAGEADIYQERAEAGADVPRSMAAGATVGAFAVQEPVGSVAGEADAEMSSSMPVYPLGAAAKGDEEEDEESISLSAAFDEDDMDGEDEDHEEMMETAAGEDREDEEDEEEPVSVSGFSGYGDDEDEDEDEEMIEASAEEEEDEEDTVSTSGFGRANEDDDEDNDDETLYASSDAGTRYASISPDDTPTFSALGEGALGDWRSAAEGILAEIEEEEMAILSSAADDDEEEDEELLSAADDDEEEDEELLSAAGDDEEEDEELLSAAGDDEEEDEELLSAAGDDEEEDEELLSAAGDDEEEDEELLSAAGDDEEEDEETLSAAGDDEEEVVVDEAGFQAAVEAAAGKSSALAHRSVLEADANGHHEVTLDFEGCAGKRVQVAGDFNGWIPDRGISTRMEQGRLVKVLNLKPGDYQYRVIVDGIWQEDPGNPVQVPNIYGGTNSLLKVDTPENPKSV